MGASRFSKTFYYEQARKNHQTPKRRCLLARQAQPFPEGVAALHPRPAPAKVSARACQAHGLSRKPLTIKGLEQSHKSLTVKDLGKNAPPVVSRWCPVTYECARFSHGSALSSCAQFSQDSAQSCQGKSATFGMESATFFVNNFFEKSCPVGLTLAPFAFIVWV